MARTLHRLAALIVANLYEELTSIDPSIAQNEKNVVIVPSIFLTSADIKANCGSLANCTFVSSQLFPNNKDELRRCLKKRQCSLAKGGQNRNHVRAGVASHAVNFILGLAEPRRAASQSDKVFSEPIPGALRHGEARIPVHLVQQ